MTQKYRVKKDKRTTSSKRENGKCRRRMRIRGRERYKKGKAYFALFNSFFLLYFEFWKFSIFCQPSSES